jgi:predicted lipase
MTYTQFLVRLSELAYVKWEDSVLLNSGLRHELDQVGALLLTTYDTTETQAMLVAKGGALIVVFRGTEKNHKDILTDLRFRFYKGTHRGFRKAWQRIAQDVAADINHYQSLSTTRKHVTCTGHSLGGALAIIAGESLKADFVMTFGCPRVHSSEVRLTVPVVRYEHGMDIVPKVPLWSLGYRHVGEKRKLKGQGWPRLSRLFTDHRIGAYKEKLYESP